MTRGVIGNQTTLLNSMHGTIDALQMGMEVRSQERENLLKAAQTLVEMLRESDGKTVVEPDTINDPN